MKFYFILISSLLLLFSYSFYARAIIKGSAKPHRTTRFVLLLISIIATASLFSQKDSVAIYLAGTISFFSGIIFILSIFKGLGGWSRSDLVCLGISFIGIILWQITNNPLVALYSAIIADFSGMIPTIVKTYKKPKTEVWYFFFLNTLASGANILALSHWEFREYIYPLYILIINIVMTAITLKSTEN